MKAQTLLLPLVLLATNSAVAGMRSDCDAAARVVVAAASTDIQSLDEALNLKFDSTTLNAIVFSNIKAVGVGKDPDRMHTVYTAKVNNKGLKGTVSMTATRGGCFLNSINLHN